MGRWFSGPVPWLPGSLATWVVAILALSGGTPVGAVENQANEAEEALGITILEEHNRVITPGDSKDFDVEITVLCELLEGLDEEPTDSTPLTTTIRIDAWITPGRTWAHVSSEPEEIEVAFTPEQCLSGTPLMSPEPAVKSETMRVSIDDDAPMTGQRLHVEVTDSNENSDSAQVYFLADFTGEMVVKTPDEKMEVPSCPNDSNTIPLEFQNAANADVFLKPGEIETSPDIVFMSPASAYLVEGGENHTLNIEFSIYEQDSQEFFPPGETIRFETPFSFSHVSDPDTVFQTTTVQSEVQVVDGPCTDSPDPMEELPAPGFLLVLMVGMSAALWRWKNR